MVIHKQFILLITTTNLFQLHTSSSKQRLINTTCIFRADSDTAHTRNTDCRIGLRWFSSINRRDRAFAGTKAASGALLFCLWLHRYAAILPVRTIPRQMQTARQ